MFLYNILTGGSSKQQLPKQDKISFKINVTDNIPQYHQLTSSDTASKPYQYDEQQSLTPNHPLYSTIFKLKLNPKMRKSSLSKLSIQQQGGKDSQHQGKLKQSSNSIESGHGQNNNNQSSSKLHDGDVVQQQQLLEQQFVSDKNADIPLSQQLQHIDDRYHYYKTTENDTLFGLALKLDIREQEIQEINGIGQLYPGMTIKLPKHCDIDKLYQQQEERGSKVKISELLGHESGINQGTLKYDVQYYAGIAGYIHGTLSINRNYIIFNPDLQDPENLKNYTIQKLLKFNAIVQTVDIQSVEVIEIPQMQQTEENLETPEENFIVQIFLYTVGNPKIQKKYQQRLVKLKSLNKPIASISFSLRKLKQKASQASQQILHQIQLILKKISSLSQSQQIIEKSNREQKHLTNIPFFDIIHENLNPKVQEQVQNIVSPPKQSISTKVQPPPSPSVICGILTETSDIISDSQFHNLSFSLPLLYQQCNWARIYSSTVNGTSFTTFLNKSKGQYPLILLVKEYKGWKFGAYLCENIETGKTGRGEMFIFTYKSDQQVPDIFKWTGKNEFFVYVEKDLGIGIGMGVKYGLFLRSTLDKGSSAQSYTFGNSESLSKKEDFTIEQVELWTVDEGY